MQKYCNRAREVTSHPVQIIIPSFPQLAIWESLAPMQEGQAPRHLGGGEEAAAVADGEPGAGPARLVRHALPPLRLLHDHKTRRPPRPLGRRAPRTHRQTLQRKHEGGRVPGNMRRLRTGTLFNRIKLLTYSLKDYPTDSSFTLLPFTVSSRIF